MKKLYRKSTVHPTPPSVVSEHLLSFLPAAILALTVALSPEDREVLAYLISCSGSYSKATSTSSATRKVQKSSTGSSSSSSSKVFDDSVDHPPCFGCNCFRCYMSYWAKWNSSTNRQLIDEIIDAYEDSLLKKESKKEKNSSKKERRKGKGVAKPKIELQLEVPENSKPCEDDSNAGGESSGGGEETVEEVVVEEELGDKGGAVRRIVNFVGERVLKLWG